MKPIFLVPVLFGLCFSLFPCTVFYASEGSVILGGNNEDWTDPKTNFFIIPAEGEKQGWIKFGYLGGWPQGGMNDQGLFWDATGSPYLGMPESEARKEKFNGPLMQKVMEECGTVEEALIVFDQFYCEDQYEAQYLIGDKYGHSVIIEGDHYITKDKRYQVVTNFYQSHPDLGGYPCWRYDTAVSMLEDTSRISTDLFGAILSATHQEGKYPTQYSNIYDLKNGKIYLFFFHNFEEVVTLDCEELLKDSKRTCAINALFSNITISGPSSGSSIDPSSVTFTWQGKKESQYQLYCSRDANFTDCDPISVDIPPFKNRMAFWGSLCLCVALFAVSRKNKRSLVLLILTFVIISSCNDKATSPSENVSNIQEITMTVNDLEPNATYYWKVVAQPEYFPNFTSESLVQTFTTTR